MTPRRSLREIREVTNHKEAFDYMLNYPKDINKTLILTIHKLVVKDTLKDDLSHQSGRYRTLQVYIRGVDWLPPPAKQVSRQMTTLLRWYTKNKEHLHPLVLAAYFYAAFEGIHPFVDGNGRVGRLLLNFILHKHGYPMINIPNRKKHTYYKTLAWAQTKDKLKPFVDFLFGLLKNEKIRY